MDKIEKLQNLIDDSDNIVFFGGAGVSTDSGIRDFRGKNGLYKNNDNLDEPPEYMLSSKCLNKEPERFFEYYRNNMNSENIEPNVTHYYLKTLEDRKKLKAIITQNIDGLHQKAGSSNVLEIHGTTKKAYCDDCNKKYDGSIIFNTNGVPKCDCGGVIRPKVVLYGEMLPPELDSASYYISQADLLIVAGTSLTVQPACGLVRLFKGKHLVILNDTPTEYDYLAELVINDSLKDVFSKLK